MGQYTRPRIRSEMYSSRAPIPSNSIIVNSHANLPFEQEIICRDDQLTIIANAMNSFIHEGKPDNLFIYGKIGTGKTMCVQHLFSKIKENGGVVPIFVNCH